MVERFFNRLVYKLYNYTRRYLLDHNCLVHKEDFDFTFWGGL